jgi:hypothetical protein
VAKDLRITLDGFLQRFHQRDQNEDDKQFCFILGAGASKPSGIRTGGELARHFLGELHRERSFEGQPLAEWATAANLNIPDFVFDKAEEYYPQLYQEHFQDRPDSGYAFLEKEMENREPSYGYSVLAWILANTGTGSWLPPTSTTSSPTRFPFTRRPFRARSGTTAWPTSCKPPCALP